MAPIPCKGVALTPDILNRYEFDFEVMEIILGGQSPIDSTRQLRIRTPEDALRFMDCYGFDLENPIEKAELFGNFQEALSFIRRYFLHPENPAGLKLEVPRKVAELTDLSQLMMMASQQQGATSLWACAIMKVIHTIVHMDKDLRSQYFTDVQTQILDRFYKFIHTDSEGQLYLGQNDRDPDRVDLLLFESKPKKSRDSVILKLLHKPENVAEDIFDRIGIRFVTKNRFDGLRVVKFLKERYVIMPANLKPSRSRNNMVNPAALMAEIARLKQEAAEGKLAGSDFEARVAQFADQDAPAIAGAAANPHTSQAYRSIQFTCRHLIKFRNHLYDDMKSLKSLVKTKSVPDEVRKVIDRMDFRNIQRETRFFYPFEVQVYDERSHQENMAGESSHSNYKKNQVQTAMKRVMGDLAKLSSES